MRLILLILIVFTGYTKIDAQRVETAFRLAEKDLIPEGITYHPGSQSFFVSSISKNKIVRIAKDGTVSDFISSGAHGIGRVLGMKIKNNELWACSNTGESNPQGKAMVHVFDTRNANLIQSWTLKLNGEVHLFNDLAVTDDGAYITDSDFGAIYRVSKQSDTPELWLKSEQFQYCNGIASIPNGEIVVNAVNGFVKFNASKVVSVLPFSNYLPICIDGLSYTNQSLIGIQNVIYPVSINRYTLDPSFNEISRAKVLTYDLPEWDIPTTGVVVDNWFYFIANSQLRNFEKSKIKDPAKLKEVLIMRVKID